jgi:hypothetical protein
LVSDLFNGIGHGHPLEFLKNLRPSWTGQNRLPITGNFCLPPAQVIGTFYIDHDVLSVFPYAKTEITLFCHIYSKTN